MYTALDKLPKSKSTRQATPPKESFPCWFTIACLRSYGQSEGLVINDKDHMKLVPISTDFVTYVSTMKTMLEENVTLGMV